MASLLNVLSLSDSALTTFISIYRTVPLPAYHTVWILFCLLHILVCIGISSQIALAGLRRSALLYQVERALQRLAESGRVGSSVQCRDFCVSLQLCSKHPP